MHTLSQSKDFDGAAAKMKKRGFFERRADIDPTEGPLFSSIIAFSIPIILSNVFAALYNSADMMVLNWFSVGNEVAAVGASSIISSLLLNVAVGLGTGGTVLLSRLFGRKDERQAERAISTMILFALGLGTALALIGALLMKPCLVWTKCPTECLDDAALYSVVYILGMPFYLLYNYAASAIRVAGDSKHPLSYMLIGGCTNVVLNVIFCLIFPRKVLAVALATLLSNALSAFLCLRLLSKSTGICRFSYKRLFFDFSVLKQLLRYGIPSAVTSMLYPIANLQMQAAINSFGPSAIAGNTAAIQYENFCANLGNGLNAGVTTFVGQNIGAGKKDRVSRSFFLVLITEFIAMFVLSIVFFAFGAPLLSVFTGPDAVAIEAGLLRMQYVQIIYFIALNPFSATLAALGYPALQTAISLIGICGLRTVWMQFIYDAVLPATINNVYLCFPATIVITQLSLGIACAVLLTRYKKDKLKEKI